MLTQVPGIDLDETGVAPLTDLGASLEADSPTVIVDATTGERHLHWAELDAEATDDDQVLMLRPGVNFEEGHRYVVGLRDLHDGMASEHRAHRHVPRLPATAWPRPSPPSRTAARPWTTCSACSTTPAWRRRALPGVGLHRGQRAQPGRADAAHARRRVRRPRRRTLPPSPRRPSPTTREAEDANIARDGRGDGRTSRCYLTGTGQPGSVVQLGRGRAPGAQRRLQRRLPVRHPACCVGC
ncbi:MAG: hypothetical protein U5R31_01300 [Acidimicrobiia bacterium]|nr:hypothetical protein [Acidimicrobiia bacterium]